MNCPVRLLAFSSVLALALACDNNKEDCPVAARDCPCSSGGTCDPGLICKENLCRSEETVDTSTNEFDAGQGTDDSNTCTGGFHDETTGLYWQDPSSPGQMTRTQADQYCRSQGPNWRLPNLTELRTIAMDCPAIETASEVCLVIDGSSSTDWNVGCMGQNNDCSAAGGPSDKGCFWQAQLKGLCNSYHWSGSAATDTGNIWIISFEQGSIYNTDNPEAHYLARCICSEPEQMDASVEDTADASL